MSFYSWNRIACIINSELLERVYLTVDSRSKLQLVIDKVLAVNIMEVNVLNTKNFPTIPRERDNKRTIILTR